MKKVGKTTRTLRYDLIQIPCDYTVEVTNRLKGLYLIDTVPEELWRFVTLYKKQGPRQSPRKRNAKKKPKWLSEEALTNSYEKKRSQRQRR